ncbi:MAG: hypothetical protein H8E66_17660 [Planctomycetes bacterium]|nr:hypothetical protein [Planctomycetota bacterium]
MKWFVTYRSLLLIYGVAMLVGLGEYLRIFKADDHGIYVDPVNNFPETIAKLYPDRPENHYHRGRRAEISLRERVTISEFQRSEREAAMHYQRGLMAGLRSDENTIYNYAIALMLIEADHAEVELAIAQWHRDFPTSKRLDLTERYAAIRQEFLHMRQGM